MLRKLKKAITKPHIYLRDSLLNKYPLHLTQGGGIFLGENHIIDICNCIESPFSPDFDIDIVYTWVTSKDDKWRKKRDLCSVEWSGRTVPFAMEESRFDDHSEIYYSLISVSKFMPWVRNIYIVTDGQLPVIPTTIRDKTFIIDHKQIIPEKFLPTFNSHVIEACLHKINGLSEHFIYFNDDFFVSREVSASHFFQSNDIASIFIGNKWIDRGNNTTATSVACNNCNRLFLERFGQTFSQYLIHTYVPLRKSYYLLAYKLWEDEIFSFLSNKFRAETDLNMATFFVPYLQFLFSAASPMIDISYYFNIRSPAASFFYNRLLDAKTTNNRPHSFCANDFSSNEFPKINCHDEFNEFAKRFYGCL
ncbi:hypothetical protein [[Enterobacter] lignolyticus]|uniref:Stealth protein CR2 conserved region 2 domain-containing protein n=1 Tax=Enterobacter lignolyticus (strain SCF1) TaxID=701347 RepID=E3G1P8_ENTLS|nr:hypothetical protein [[Enterobacter] lignolyticus]ADO46853.1 hypothetical protein Entcl_0576 [[Enterobacter] lignolyticus SCF1]